jgi:putative tryptophan/tyrosine transport system substrate-binding protein
MNLFVEYCYAEGKLDRLSSLAAELVHLKVDVIVTASPPATRSAKQATVTIPIVIAFDDDPVGSGFAANLARAWRKHHGSSTLSPEISGKQLELLKKIVPKLSRLAISGDQSIRATRSVKRG